MYNFYTRHHLRICFCAVQQFLRSNIRLRFPIKFGTSFLLLFFRKKFLKTSINYDLPQCCFDPIFSHVFLHKFIQLYNNVRRNIVHTILLHCPYFRFYVQPDDGCI